MRYEKPSFAGGEIAPALYARIDTAKYQTALKRCRNFLVMKYGGVQRRPGTLLVGTVAGKTGTARVISFRFSTDQAYVLEFTNLKMRVIKDGAYVLSATAKTITGISQASQGVVTAVAHGFSNGDEVYLAAIAGMTQLNGRTVYVSDVATDTFKMKDVNGAYISTSAMSAYTSGGTATELYEIATPYAEADLFDIRYEQSADVMYLAHPSYEPQKLARADHNSWSISAVSFVTSLTAPTGLSAVETGGGSGVSYDYYVTALDTVTGDESVVSSVANIPSARLYNDGGGDTNKNTLSWSAVAGADRYRVYKESGGVLGFIGSTDGLGLVDDGIEQDATDTPPQARNPFDATDDYPSAVTFFEQRLCWGGTNNKPNGFFSSRSGSFENMNVSYPTRADDAITAGLVAREVNVVQHLVPLEDLLAFTSAAVFRINGGGQSDFISPSSFISRVQAYRGASNVRPAVIDSVVLYWQARGAQLRTLGFQFDTDGYRGSDLTIFAPHLFKGRTIVDQAYTQHPLSTLWAVGDDGALYALTWELEQDVWGWAKCTTDGTVKSVACIPQDGEDVLYMVVERTVGSVARRYVERLGTALWEDIADAVYVDSGVAYSGSAATTFSGLEHLEGETVVAVADGAAQSGLVVSGGVVTLSSSATDVVIGLPFTSVIETLPPGFSSPGGSLQGVKKSHNQLTLRVEKTRGLSYGVSEDDLYDVKDRTDDDDLDSPPALLTGDIELTLPVNWTTNPTFVVVQSNPLPATITGAFPSIAIGG